MLKDITVTTDSPTTALPNSDCLTDAARDIFAATCGTQVQPVLGSCDNILNNEVILSVISLVGDVEWSVFLALPRETASALAQKFAGFEIDFESDDMGDAIGELTNILAGDVKAKLDQRGRKAEISLPSVMRCSSLQVLIPRDAPVQRFCYTTPGGPFLTGIICSRKSA